MKNSKPSRQLNNTLTGKKSARKNVDVKYGKKQEENSLSPPSPHTSWAEMVVVAFVPLIDSGRVARSAD